jgi:beta-phosphoglucomutase
MTMTRALIFDFDGVIVDSEKLHLKAMQKALGEVGIELTDEAYVTRYLGLDDKKCFKTVGRDQGNLLDEETISGIVDRKTALYSEWKDEVPIVAGASEFVRWAAERYHLAIGSGSFRHEIEYALHRAGIRDQIQVIVSAEDIGSSKPAPDCYLEVLRRLNLVVHEGETKIEGPECVVIEDALHGITAARAAGMRCVGVTSTLPASELKTADWVVGAFSEMYDLVS